MAKKKKKAAPKRTKRSQLKYNLISVALVALVLYAGVHIISRTAGARAAIADKISNATRQPVALEKCEATPLLGLRLQGLCFEGVDVPDAKISFNWLALFSKERPLVKKLQINGLEIRFRRVPVTGNWEPLVLHGVGRRLGAVLGLNPARMSAADSLPEFPAAAIINKTLLELDHAKIVWRDESGREIAYITEADLNVKAGALIKRKAIQAVLRCGHIKLASGRTLRDFRVEALRVEGSRWITVLDLSDSNGEYDEFATQNLWPDLYLRLHQLSNVR